MENKKVTIYEDIYCAKCEDELSSENHTDISQHCGFKEYFYCDQCWNQIPDGGW